MILVVTVTVTTVIMTAIIIHSITMTFIYKTLSPPLRVSSYGKRTITIDGCSRRCCTGERVGPPVWGGCLAALAGGVLMSASNADGGPGAGLATGDVLLVGAALMWSLQVILFEWIWVFPPAYLLVHMVLLVHGWLLVC